MTINHARTYTPFNFHALTVRPFVATRLTLAIRRVAAASTSRHTPIDSRKAGV